MPTTTTNAPEPLHPSRPGHARAAHAGHITSLDQLALQSQQRPVWLRVGQLIDGISSAPTRDADVIFDAHQIRHVGPHGAPIPAELLAPGQSTPDFTLTESTLLPTLIEAHAHLFLDGAPLNFAQRDQYLKESPEWMLDRARARWPKILQFGIGTVRDAGDK
ncbi:MAG TPA: hypothetical protein VLJ39_01355, partial [Tepidisphaeraceae bacterium]|nr:hypothetical protein [Tepidisphaeraceae bacterium]